MSDWRDKILRWIVWRLPRCVVYWCYLRVVAKATSGEHGYSASELKAMDALSIWGAKP